MLVLYVVNISRVYRHMLCIYIYIYPIGRGKNSYAYAHSFDLDHHVFLNLSTKQVYILPEGYEETDPSLQDIKYVLDPTFTPELVHDLENKIVECVDLNKKPYVPGYIGLNNLKSNDYINTVVHALSQVAPLKRYFLLSKYQSNNELGMFYCFKELKILMNMEENSQEICKSIM